MASTKYSVQVATTEGTFESLEGTFSKKQSAVTAAETHATENGVATQVVTDAGTVVAEFEAPSDKRTIVNKTAPYTRVQVDLPEGFKTPKGYVAVYCRSRAGLVVCRSLTAKDDYLVVEAATGEQHSATNTKETSKIMVALGQVAKIARDAEQAEAKEAAAVARAEAKAAKDAEREAAKVAKAEAKAFKDAEKAAAKAAKAAAAEAEVTTAA